MKQLEVINSKKLGECKVCRDEMIQLWLSDGSTEIFNNHVKGCPNAPKSNVGDDNGAELETIWKVTSDGEAAPKKASK